VEAEYEMMMRQVDTVVFDVGNVLIRWDVHNLYRKMFPNDAAIAAFLEQTKLLVRNHYEFDKGEPFAEGLADLARQFPHHAKPLAAFDERWAECLNGAINGNVTLLRDLKAAGVPVHAITNFNEAKFREAQTIFPFLNEFDETIVSGIEQLIKPEPEIFQVLLARRGLIASQCVFIDDSAANIATAKELGFKTVHYAEGHTDVRSVFQSLGLPV
jgi:2-haloacid dehalogenase